MTSVALAMSGPTAILRFGNPPDHMIDNKGAVLLGQAVERCLGDDAVRAIVITGAGEDVFIRHAEVGQISRAAEALRSGAIEPNAFLDAPFPRLGRTLDAATKPVIAAIDGTCMGGGLEIAIACTMRVAGRRVGAIGLPEIRIGVFPGSGGTQRLARLIGWQRARVFILRGEVVDAAAAHALGLVDEVAEDALARALEIAAELGTRTPAAVGAVLSLTRSRDLDQGLEAELIAFATLLRDDAAAREQLDDFVTRGGRLDQLP